MRTTTLLLLSSALVAAASTPAFAQLSGGVGSSNATNQSFQQQNSLRGAQQQNQFNNNQNTLNRQINQMNTAPRNTGPIRRDGRRR